MMIQPPNGKPNTQKIPKIATQLSSMPLAFLCCALNHAPSTAWPSRCFAGRGRNLIVSRA
jgi:hypothetical protein